MKNDLIVKKPDEIVKMRCGFSESALKLSAYVISLLKEDKYEYKINIREYLRRFDKELGDFEKLYETAKEIATKTIEFVDREKKEFAIYTIFYSPKYENGVLRIKIDNEFHKYLMAVKNKYLRYRLENVMVLTSKYSIRLYEILKNELKMRKRQKRSLEVELDLDELRELLSVPGSYKWQDIKRQILEKSQKDFEKTDIDFEFEPIKQGRKVTAIKFKLIDKSKKLQTDNRIYKIDNDFTQWRKELQKKDGLILKINNQVFEIKDGLLTKNDKILDKEEAWKSWKFLFKNRDKIKFLSKEDLKKEINEEIKQKILETFKDKEFKAIPVEVSGNIEYVNANLINITNFEDMGNFVATFKSGERTFAKKLGINTLKSWLV
jgi:plasmid replication initiation protein